MKAALIATLLPLALAACAAPDARPTPADAAQDAGDRRTHDAAAALDAVLAGDWRTPAFVARDDARNPRQTLLFFGLRPDHTVIEITPGGGWYTEILAPYLSAHGQYHPAIVNQLALPEDTRAFAARAQQSLSDKLGEQPDLYGRADVVLYDPAAPRFGPDNSADLVLTFRNVHNWRSSGQAQGMFDGFYAALKPGGVLGVVEHRAAGDVPDDDRSGYVGQDQVIALAQAAGFRLDASSEINANPADTRDHPNGVWTLPPSNRHAPEEAARYQAIGESDRMTLRFVKPL